MRKSFASALVALALSGLTVSCSHSLPVQQEKYAHLPSSRTFEYEFPVVWKGIESAMQELPITSRDPSEVSEVEMRKLTQRSLETDWIYSQSHDKYIEYQVNGSPRRQYVQVRFMYRVEAKSRIGGTDVSVRTTEEIENLKPDGHSAGFTRVDQPDSSRASELLDQINNAILSSAP